MLEIFLLTVKVVLASMMIALVGHQLWANKTKLDFTMSVWKKFRVLMFLEVIVAIVITIATTLVLIIYIPFLKWGWLAPFLNSDTGGNMLVAPIMDASDSSSVILRIVPVMFLVGLLIILPFLAKREEEDYRRGHNTYKAIILKSIPFGLVHLLAGIPLAAGFDLIGVGIFYGHKYKTALDKLTPSMPYELCCDGRNGLSHLVQQCTGYIINHNRQHCFVNPI